MRSVSSHRARAADPQPPQELPAQEQHLHLLPRTMARVPRGGTKPHPCPSFYMTISVFSSDILMRIWQVVRSIGRPTSFSSSLKVAVDALLQRAMAVCSQPGTGSRCAPLVGASLPRCLSLQSLTGFSGGELWSKLSIFDA